MKLCALWRDLLKYSRQYSQGDEVKPKYDLKSITELKDLFKDTESSMHCKIRKG